MTASWTRPVPGLFVTGLGARVINAALGRIAVESVPHGCAGMGGGANNTARYLGTAAGAALIVSIASAGGTHGLIAGWNHGFRARRSRGGEIEHELKLGESSPREPVWVPEHRRLIAWGYANNAVQRIAVTVTLR